jgi:hypothetical protein
MHTYTLLLLVTACAVAAAVLGVAGGPVWVAAPVAILATTCAVLVTPRLLRKGR